MTIDEAIGYADKSAEVWENDAKKWFEYTRSFGAYKGACEECIKCKKHAEKQHQLADWLRELKEYKIIFEKIRAKILEEKECAYADFELYKVKYLGQDWEEAYCGLPEDDFRYGMERCIDIIDEYIQKVR